MLIPIDHDLVLLAEDDIVQRVLIHKYFATSFPELVLETCENGKEVLDFLRKEGRYSGSQELCPTLIVMDDEMPIMSGIEACRCIRSDSRFCKTSIVIHSSGSRPETIRQAYQSGANSYVVKSSKPDQYRSNFLHVVRYWQAINFNL